MITAFELLEIRETNICALLLSTQYEALTVRFLGDLSGGDFGHGLDLLFDTSSSNCSFFRDLELMLGLDNFALDNEGFSCSIIN